MRDSEQHSPLGLILFLTRFLCSTSEVMSEMPATYYINPHTDFRVSVIGSIIIHWRGFDGIIDYPL